jgi:hypothetical protein
MKLLAAKEWNKVFYANGEKYRLEVRAELVHLDGNNSPYFSIGGDIFRLAKNGRSVWESGGCIHEEIVKHFPKLQPLVDIHLSDENGVPMHAYANAGYWAGHCKIQPEKNTDILAKHLRVSKEKANEMTTYINLYYGEFTTPESAWKNTCQDFDLPKQWAAEAEAALALLNKIGEEK